MWDKMRAKPHAVLIAFSIVIVLIAPATAQGAKEAVVHLRDGTRIQRIVDEYVPNDHITIRSTDGILFNFQADVIKQVSFVPSSAQSTTQKAPERLGWKSGRDQVNRGHSLGMSIGLLHPLRDRFLDGLLVVEGDLPSNVYLDIGYTHLILRHFAIDARVGYSRSKFKISTDLDNSLTDEPLVIGGETIDLSPYDGLSMELGEMRIIPVTVSAQYRFPNRSVATPYISNGLGAYFNRFTISSAVLDLLEPDNLTIGDTVSIGITLGTGVDVSPSD